LLLDVCTTSRSALFVPIGFKWLELGISLVVASARCAHYQREKAERQPVNRLALLTVPSKSEFIHASLEEGQWNCVMSQIRADLIAANNAGVADNPSVSPALLMSESNP
jgi:hypothetical protein